MSQFPKKEICHHLFGNDTILHNVKQFKYLRVTFSFDTTLSAHINTVSLKARRLIGMLYHKLYCYANTSSLLIFYLTTVQPHLEYASSVWDPYFKKDILNVANIPTLASRRQQLKLLSVI